MSVSWAPCWKSAELWTFICMYYLVIFSVFVYIECLLRYIYFLWFLTFPVMFLIWDRAVTAPMIEFSCWVTSSLSSGIREY